MRTNRYRLSKPARSVQLSRRALRIGAIALGLVLLIDIITVRYFSQAQAALTLPHAQQDGSTAHQPPASGHSATASVSATTIPTLKQLAQDTFARPDQPLWGTASDGQQWSYSATQSPALSILNHLGLVSNASGIYDAILGPRSSNSEVVFSGTVSHFAQANMGALLRWTDSNNLYKVFIDGTDLVALKKVNGVVTVLQTVPFPARDGVSYTIRARAAGANIMARAWPTGQAEPSTWLLTTSDSDLASGYDGLRLIVQKGVTIAIASFLEMQV